MATLIVLQGPEPGRRIPLDPGTPTVFGRQHDCTAFLDAKAVSRAHAQITCEHGAFFVQDMGSSNGTFVNGARITGKVPLSERDSLQIGPYLFALEVPTPPSSDENLIIREQVNATASNQTLYRQDPAQKLQVILEISQHLARTLDMNELLNKLVDHLLGLFPQADRALILLFEGTRLVVRAQRSRQPDESSSNPFSRTIVKRALDEGVGILSDDVRSDQRFQAVQTITNLNVRTLLCVPLIAQDGKRLGVVQMDRFLAGLPFRLEDLQLLTAVRLQVAVVLENAALHAELLREERFRQELAMAREIQQNFLPTNFAKFKNKGFELFAQVNPARQVSGDLYDFFLLPDGRLAFFVGDVSGKGMPSALFMIAVRTLIRHLASAALSPTETLRKLNSALAADNPTSMFVTMIHGIYHPTTGEVVVASGGHPFPLVRHAQGQVTEVPLKSGRLLGFEGDLVGLQDARLVLGPGELLVLYTDGYTEAREPEAKTMFGLERLQQVVQGFGTTVPLTDCVAKANDMISQYTRSADLQDDLTLLLLRRPAPAAAAPAR